MKKWIEFTAAYDKRSANPKKNYGIHGVDVTFYLKGRKGVVQFQIFTNWYLPHVQEELDAKNFDHKMCHPMPADLGYHSKTKRYPKQTVSFDDCRLTGGKCYYDGSGLNAKPVYEVLLKEGSDGVWRELEKYYEQVFGVKP